LFPPVGSAEPASGSFLGRSVGCAAPLGDAFPQRPQNRLVSFTFARTCLRYRRDDRGGGNRTLHVCSLQGRDRSVLDQCVELVAHHDDSGGLVFGQFDRVGEGSTLIRTVPSSSQLRRLVDSRRQSGHRPAVKRAPSAISSSSTWRCCNIASAGSSPETTVRSASGASTSVVRAARSCARSALDDRRDDVHDLGC
jgi:hypothetical protein